MKEPDQDRSKSLYQALPAEWLEYHSFQPGLVYGYQLHPDEKRLYVHDSHIDVYSRKVVGWGISNCMSAQWCATVLEDVCYSKPHRILSP